MPWLLWSACALGVMATGLWPPLQHRLVVWRVKQQAQHWMMQLESAQQQAMALGQHVTVRPTYDKQHCAQDWLSALSMQVSVSSGVLGHFDRGRYLYGTNWRADRVVFQPLGGTMGRQGRWLWGTDRYCCWQVIVSHTGRLRLVFSHANLVESALF